MQYFSLHFYYYKYSVVDSVKSSSFKVLSSLSGLNFNNKQYFENTFIFYIVIKHKITKILH